MKKIVLMALTASALAGCSDPKSATDSNFKAAIQNYLDTQKPSISLSETFPAQVPKSNINEIQRLNILVNVGLLSAKEQKIKEQSLFGSTNMVPGIVYTLTKDGKEFSHRNKPQMLSWGGTDFFYGKYTVESISNYSEPSSVDGMKISNVNYTYEITDLADWFKKLEHTNNSSLLAGKSSSENKPIKGSTILILTNKGWVTQKMFLN